MRRVHHRAGRRDAAAAFGALAGLSLSHHGLLPYLYLPLRHAAGPAFNYARSYDASGAFAPVDLQSPGGLWWLVSGRAFAGQMLGYGDSSFWGEARHFGEQLWRSFFGIGIGPVLLRRSWRLGGMLLLLFLGNAICYIDYRVLDKDTMFLPNYAVWLAVGYQWLIDWLASPAGQHRAARALQAALVGAALLACADLSGDWSARGEAVLAEAEQGALVLGWWDTVPVVQYLQLVEGRRPVYIDTSPALPRGRERKGRRPLHPDHTRLVSECVRSLDTIHARQRGKGCLSLWCSGSELSHQSPLLPPDLSL